MSSTIKNGDYTSAMILLLILGPLAVFGSGVFLSDGIRDYNNIANSAMVWSALGLIVGLGLTVAGMTLVFRQLRAKKAASIAEPQAT